MIVGVPSEVRAGEHRVAATPAGVEVLVQRGHRVLVEQGAGAKSGFDDEAYARAGAELVPGAAEVFGRADLVVRVKAPEPTEYALLREGQVYFSYLHLAAAEGLTRALVRSRCVALAYETVQAADGSLPLLTPMSEVAGAMAVQEGAKYLEMAQGGHGVLLGGVPGVEPAVVVVLGAGVVGHRAARVACGLGAVVYLLDTDLERLRRLADVVPKNAFALMSSPAAIRDLLPRADLVVGAVLVPGSRTPVLVPRRLLTTMKRGAVVVDVSIDQGGCFETSRETTHQSPTFTAGGVVHYCVGNMPGALPRTSTLALTNATWPYVVELADKGWRRALAESPALRGGANAVDGRVTCPGVAAALGLEHTAVDTLL
ncbi:MAG: alanine dehydrogenase [Deferrisomatales bacterium]